MNSNQPTDNTIMNDTWKPRPEFLQADCDHWNATRDCDAAHKAWMNTNVFTEAGRIARAKLSEACEREEKARKAAGL